MIINDTKIKSITVTGNDGEVLAVISDSEVIEKAGISVLVEQD